MIKNRIRISARRNENLVFTIHTKPAILQKLGNVYMIAFLDPTPLTKKTRRLTKTNERTISSEITFHFIQKKSSPFPGSFLLIKFYVYLGVELSPFSHIGNGFDRNLPGFY